MKTTKRSLLDSRFVLPVLLLFGAALRAGYLGSSYCLDDHMSLRNSLFLYTPFPERFRPLFFSLLHIWRSIGPDSEWWLQLLPFLFSVASLPLAWFVGLRLGGRRLAVVLTLLLATSPLHLDISAEVRMYAMLPVFSLTQYWCYLSFRERRRPWSLVMSAAIGALGLYTQPMYGIFLIGMFALMLLDRRQIKIWPVFASFAGTGLLYLPNLGNFAQYSEVVRSGPQHMFTTHVGSAFFKYLAAYTSGFALFKVEDLGLGAKFGLREVLGNLPVVLLACVTFALILAGAARKLSTRDERFVRHTVLTLAILPAVIAYTAVVLLHRDYTHAHYHVYSIPFVCLLFAAGFSGLQSRWIKLMATGLYSILIAIVLFRFYFIPTDYGRRQDWHKVTTFIQNHTSPHDPIMVLRDPTVNEVASPELPYYTYHLRSRWLPITVPTDSAEIRRFQAYLDHEIGARRHVYYLWEAGAKNVLDPRNYVLQAMRQLGKNETRLKINPRLSIYGWDLRRDAIIRNESEASPVPS